MAISKTEFGTGPLFTVANTVYGVLICHLLLVLVNLPLVLSPLLLTFLGSTAGSSTAGSTAAGTAASTTAAGTAASTTAAVAVVLLASLPVGPSVVAAMTTCRKLLNGREGSLPRTYFRALIANAKEAGAVWLPALAVLALIAFNLLNLASVSAELQPALRAALLVSAILACTVTANALLIVSRFRFRTLDVFRLAFSCLGAQKRSSLGNLTIIVLTAWVLTQTTVFLLLVVGGGLVYALCWNSRPMMRFIEERFTAAAA